MASGKGERDSAGHHCCPADPASLNQIVRDKARQQDDPEDACRNGGIGGQARQGRSLALKPVNREQDEQQKRNVGQNLILELPHEWIETQQQDQRGDVRWRQISTKHVGHEEENPNETEHNEDLHRSEVETKKLDHGRE